jgi:hypothetical protein
MPARCGVTLLFACWLLADAPFAEPRPDAFGVGVLRRDGIVIPFADFDGKRWHANWPAAAQQVDVPVNVPSVPAPWWGKAGPHENWQVWTRSAPPMTVHVRQPDWVPVQCLRQVGLRTDYRSAEPPPDPASQPFPKDGLAIWPPQRIEKIDIVPVGQLSPEAVIDAFNAAEETARRYERGQAAYLPSDRKARESTVPMVEAIYAAGDTAGARIYYFEASRQYSLRNVQCPLVTFGAGWFVREGASGLRKLRFDVEVVDCERYGLLYMLPLGAVTLSNRLYWIAQWSGWDYEEYGVVEIKQKSVDDVVQVLGGRC